MKFLLGLVLLLIIFGTFANAQLVVNETPQVPSDQPGVNQQNAQQITILQKVTTIETKIGELPTKEYVDGAINKSLQENVNYTNHKIDDLILINSLVTVSGIAMVAAIYFYFKGRGRL